MAAVTLVPCACGCDRWVLPVWRARFATVDCRTRGAHCRVCRQAPATPGCVTCEPCRTRKREATYRSRARGALAEVYRGAGNVEAVFQAAKARARREWHVDGWSQRMSYGQYIDR